MRDALAVLRSEGNLTNAKIRDAIQYVPSGKVYFSSTHNFVQAFLQPHKLLTYQFNSQPINTCTS